MKIAILTLTPTHNYGGILQAVALYNYLKNRGDDVVLINKIFIRPLWKKCIFYFLKKIPYQNIKNQREAEIKGNQLKPFIRKYITKFSGLVVTKSDLEMVINNEDFDAVIVGSDQVWRYQYIKDGHHAVFFLDFNVSRKVKKIAYAASFGNDGWEAPEEVKKISKMLNRFDAISTREINGIDICKQTFEVQQDVECVLDPTMLVKPSFYEDLIDDCDTARISNKFVTYILDKTPIKQNIICSVRKAIGYSDLECQQLNLAGSKKGRYYKVEEWLAAIKNATFVVTDSFHGMVFSIIFNKQFIVIGNPGRGLSRFHSLLGQLGLLDRLVTDLSDEAAIGKIISEEINFDLVNRKIDAVRKTSSDFLNRAFV